jgi:hypothetical protein
MSRGGKIKSVRYVLMVSCGVLSVTGCASTPLSRPSGALADGLDLLASVPPIEPRELPRLHALIRPGPAEEAFLQIPWLTSLSAARRKAAEEDRPVLAFLMSGNPLGCT